MGRQKEEIKDSTSHGTSTGSHLCQVISSLFFPFCSHVSPSGMCKLAGFFIQVLWSLRALSAQPTSHLLPEHKLFFPGENTEPWIRVLLRGWCLLQGVSQTAPSGKCREKKSRMAKESPTPWHHSPAALHCVHTKTLVSLLNLREKKSLINLNDSLDCIHIPGNKD